MVTYLRQGLTNFPTSVTGGSIPDTQVIEDISEWAEALEPRKTPLLTLFGMGPAINTRPHYWGQSYRTKLDTTVAEVLDNSETGIDVAAGMGTLFNRWAVVEIVDFVSAGSTVTDETTKEICVVTADPSGDTIVVARGQGGTSAVSHLNGAKISIIGQAEPQLNTHSISPVARGSRAYNYVQRFQGGVLADIAARNTPTWEFKNDPFISDFEEVQKTLKLELELSIWRGGRQPGDVNTPLPAMFGGIDTYITTNVTNMANAKLNLRTVESELRDLAKSIDGGPDGVMLLMSYDTAAIFDVAIDSIKRADVNETEVSLVVDRVKFRFGTFDIGVSHNARNGAIWGIRKECCKVLPYQGANWHISKKDGKMHGVDHDEMYVSGDFTLQVTKEASMFKLWNFNQDLDSYDTPFGKAGA